MASVNFGSFGQVNPISSRSDDGNEYGAVRQPARSRFAWFVFICVILASRFKSPWAPAALYCCFILVLPSKTYILPMVESEKFPTAGLIMFSVVQRFHLTPPPASKTSVLRKTCGKHVRVCLLLDIVKLHPWQHISTMRLVLKFMDVPQEKRPNISIRALIRRRTYW